MKRSAGRFWIGAVTAACVVGVAGCNGSDDREPTPAAAPAPVPGGDPAIFPITMDTAPTGVVAATDEAGASALAARFQQLAEEAAQAARLAEFRATPASSAVRAMATVTYNCAQFLGDGATGKVSYTHPDTLPTAGWKTNLTFDNCTYTSGTWAYSVKGAFVYEYLRYVSGSDFGFRGTTQDLTLSYLENGKVIKTGTLVFNHTFDLHDGKITTSYQTPVSAMGNVTIARSGANVTVNASSVVDLKNIGGAVIRGQVVNWTYDMSRGRSLAGNAFATGASNTRAEVTVTSTGYTVVYTAANGSKTTYNVPHPG